MKISEKQMLTIKYELLDHIGAERFNVICEVARNYIDNTPLYDGGYSNFWINKRTKEKVFSKSEVERSSDKFRKICAPRGSWKVLCKNLNKLFMPFVTDRYWLHGFVEGKGVCTNAEYHVRNGAKNCLNIDLKDAFNQIHHNNIKQFAQVVFGWKSKTADKFAIIMTYNDQMVQGNPLSPMLMNLFALYLDFRILEFIKTQKSLYMTRYADDITISSKSKISTKTFVVVNKIISQCGWKSNRKKTKFRWNLLEITGIMVRNGKRWKPRRGLKRRLIKDLRALKRMLQKGKIFLDRRDKNGNPISTEMVISGIYAWLFPKAAKRKGKKVNKKFRNNKHKFTKMNKKFIDTKQDNSSSELNQKFTNIELHTKTSFLMMKPNGECRW